MYFSTITNKELAYFHNRPVHNFTVKLSQVLTSPIFKVEEIITDSIYKIFPLFYTNEITSSNSNDKILENKCIICQKTENETYLTFISDETAEIVDYSEYGTYYEIGDKLTESEFNAYISLLKQNVRHGGSFRISQGEIQGSYGTYEFDIDGATLIDNGIIVTDETIASQPKVKLTDNVFRWSSYILKLDIIHYTGVNILDDTTSDFKVVETIEIELTPNEWVDIPVETLETDYIISLDATVEIQHDRPEIHMITGLKVNATPQILQNGETSDITAELLDSDGLHYDLSDSIGRTVYFYEVLTPSFTLNVTPSIIQTGEHSEITCKVKDEDGSLAQNVQVHFYQRTASVPTTVSVVADNPVLSYSDGDSAVLSATVLDQYGDAMGGQSVVFKLGSSVVDTVLTDSSGVAEYEYTSQGVGDVTITAECGQVSDDVTIEDCVKYTTDSFNLAPNQGITQISNIGFSNTGNWETSWDMNLPRGACRVVVYDSSDTGIFLGIGASDGDVRRIYWTVSDSSHSTFSYNIDYTMRIVKENGEFKIYSNGSLLNTISLDSLLNAPTINMGVRNWGSGTGIAKNIKIKPL